MDYITYMKQEVEKTIFIEINDDLTLDISNKPILKKGEYPILSKDLVEIAKKNSDLVTPIMLIKGMVYLIGCDPEFKYCNNYISFFKSVPELESYIIMNINENKNNDMKSALIFANALAKIHPKKEYNYNRAMVLMELFENTNLSFLEEEILSSLRDIIEKYPEYTPPYYHLGKYYLEKDVDLSKAYLRRCIGDSVVGNEALKLVNQIENGEKYDNAIELIKNGLGMEALKILIPITVNYPDNLDAKYYTAIAYRRIENNTKALIYLKELTEFAERAEVYSEIALNLAQLDDFEGALEYFKKGLKITPDDTGILCNIGVCQLNLGDFTEALKTFELAHRLCPEDDIALEWIEKINEAMQN